VIDKNLIVAKASSVKRHLKRLIEKRDTDLESFLEDIDRQESILASGSTKRFEAQL